MTFWQFHESIRICCSWCVLRLCARTRSSIMGIGVRITTSNSIWMHMRPHAERWCGEDSFLQRIMPMIGRPSSRAIACVSSDYSPMRERNRTNIRSCGFSLYKKTASHVVCEAGIGRPAFRRRRSGGCRYPTRRYRPFQRRVLAGD